MDFRSSQVFLNSWRNRFTAHSGSVGLLGLIWAMLYLFIAETIPGAFNSLPQVPWLDNFANAVYFSFVTITTLGYGDISPALPLPRFLVYMEAIVGVFYMAILVASLIGIRISDREAVHK